MVTTPTPPPPGPYFSALARRVQTFSTDDGRHLPHVAISTCRDCLALVPGYADVCDFCRRR